MRPSAEVICDSISPAGKRLTSFQITAHRFILAEINTHRTLSRSYRSSRAVPSAKLIAEVRTNPAMPVHWGVNQKGMQAGTELIGDQLQRAQENWKFAAQDAAMRAEMMAEGGLHKQIANRIIEPYLWVHGIITATEFDNFFGLRLHVAAQPEFRALADAMWAAMKASEPTPLAPGEWYLPFVGRDHEIYLILKQINLYGEASDNYDLAKVCSRARCARVSTTSFETGKDSTIAEDLITSAKLNIPGTDHYDAAQPIHASPAEHQATPDEPSNIYMKEWQYPEEHGNLVGWRQHRKQLPGEARAPLPTGLS